MRKRTKVRKDLPKPGEVVSAEEAKRLLALDTSENEIQREAVKALRSLGYRVLVNNAGLRSEAAKALREANIKKGGVFATPGIPDISVRHEFWQKGLWCLIELKTAEGKMTDKQAEIHAYGGSYLCRSVDEVLAAVRDFEGSDAVKNPRRLAA